MESKVNSPLKVSLVEWESGEVEESEFQKSVRKLESKQRASDSTLAVKSEKSMTSQVDLCLEGGTVACTKERHPELRTSGQVSEYTRHAAAALSSQRDLASQEKLKLKKNYRSGAQSTTCSSRGTFFKAAQACRDAEALVRLLDFEYSVEEVLLGAVLGFKGGVTLAKCLCEAQDVFLKYTRRCHPRGTSRLDLLHSLQT